MYLRPLCCDCVSSEACRASGRRASTPSAPPSRRHRQRSPVQPSPVPPRAPTQTPSDAQPARADSTACATHRRRPSRPTASSPTPSRTRASSRPSRATTRGRDRPRLVRTSGTHTQILSAHTTVRTYPRRDVLTSNLHRWDPHTPQYDETPTTGDDSPSSPPSRRRRRPVPTRARARDVAARRPRHVGRGANGLAGRRDAQSGHRRRRRDRGGDARRATARDSERDRERAHGARATRCATTTRDDAGSREGGSEGRGGRDVGRGCARGRRVDRK